MADVESGAEDLLETSISDGTAEKRVAACVFNSNTYSQKDVRPTISQMDKEQSPLRKVLQNLENELLESVQTN